MSHEQAKKALAAGMSPELVCATCPWDRLCIEPPKMSAAEIDRQIKDAEEKDKAADPEGKRMPVSMLLTTVTLAGRDTAGRLCPVFAARLSGPDGRAVADLVRTAMRSWVDGS